jgi:hypothetical protein
VPCIEMVTLEEYMDELREFPIKQCVVE